MTRCIRLATVMAAVTLLFGADLVACGDKFLVAGRGTRYQRPRNARNASIVIYANPSTDNRTIVGSSRMESMLKGRGHSATTVTTSEQLSAILNSGRFDVVLVASDMAGKIKQLISATHGAAVVLAVDGRPSAAKLLRVVDQAVEQHDRNLRTNRSAS
jgi:hypothetical protein